MRVDRFVDTNVLLAGTARHHAAHASALLFLNSGFADRSLFLSGQVVREYLVVATRPAAVNGLGLSMEAALGNVGQFVARATCLSEDAAVRDALLRLLETTPVAGKQVHDANVVATMLTHGVKHLVTLNPRDFERFTSAIHVSGLGGG
jgi:predicted nucleic acid-binding protein